MTKADFTPDEWKILAAPSAVIVGIVVTRLSRAASSACWEEEYGERPRAPSTETDADADELVGRRRLRDVRRLGPSPRRA